MVEIKPRGLAVAVATAAAIVGMPAVVETPAGALSTGMVIGEVYGGGGNNAAPFTNDYVELFNRSLAAIDVTGWSVQYASATGSTWAVTPLTPLAPIPPGGHVLVQEGSGGASGGPLPPANTFGTTNLSATAGKVGLVSTTTALVGTTPSSSGLVDLVGYGPTASAFEGGLAAPSSSNTTSVTRRRGGCRESDVNGADFVEASPTPEALSAPLVSCAVAGKPADFDGDGKTDLAVFRPQDGTWYVHESGGGDMFVGWGQSSDLPVVGDFDADGQADAAIFRPSTGLWAIHPSGGGPDVYVTYGGVPGDIPVVADYDGDSRSDIAIFRPSVGTWYINQSSDGVDVAVAFGIAGDVPVVADYDGDSKADLAMFRPGEGNWYVHQSSGGDVSVGWGTEGDLPVAGDFNGDAKADVTIFRPGTGLWASHRTGDGGDSFVTYGLGGDVPVVADYDGDGKADIGVFRPSVDTWYVNESATATDALTTFGISTDVPVVVPPSVYYPYFS